VTTRGGGPGAARVRGEEGQGLRVNTWTTGSGSGRHCEERQGRAHHQQNRGASAWSGRSGMAHPNRVDTRRQDIL
jgi:hypothetical protein